MDQEGGLISRIHEHSLLHGGTMGPMIDAMNKLPVGSLQIQLFVLKPEAMRQCYPCAHIHYVIHDSN